MAKGRRRAGILFMIAGAVLIFSALSLLIYNRLQDRKAAEASESILPLVEQEISETEADEAEYFSDEMTVVDIDGYGYIGYITIPELDVELPVMAEWDYPRLRIAPCRQAGTARGGGFVIAAHNYSSHFGRISSLSPGDSVQFCDMDGNRFSYSVVSIETLEATDVEKMLDKNWDLTLYTCTYGGRQRITVRCMRDS